MFIITPPFFPCRISKKETDPAEAFAKKILKGTRGEEYLDLLLRDCVREFPYREGLLFQQVIRNAFMKFEINTTKVTCLLSRFISFPQMVKSLARKEEAPPALDVIIGAINSQSGFSDEYSPCITCSEPKAIKKCSKCKAVQYCDRECQRLHWFMHKKECARSSTNSNCNSGKDKGDEVLTDDFSGEVECLKI